MDDLKREKMAQKEEEKRGTEKILLMGVKRAGKTSMRSMIFANLLPKDTYKLVSTIDVQQENIRFLGNLDLNVWECGGQEKYQQQHLTTQCKAIFSNVRVMIYVFDIESRERNKEMKYYRDCLKSLNEFSPNAHVFCFVHKMDLVSKDLSGCLYDMYKARIHQISKQKKVVCFPTSIFDETLYKAWSILVQSLIPNLPKIQQRLATFCEVSEAVEVVLFEHVSFLVIAYVTLENPCLEEDLRRFERTSHILKSFKLTCDKLKSSFKKMEIRNEHFSGFLERFTMNTYLLVITKDKTLTWTTTRKNIKQIRPHFERYLFGQ